MNSAIIVAGGDSSRIDDIIPKQYIILDGREILNYSATTFLNHPAIDEVVIVCKPEWINHVTSHYQKCKIVKSGERRQDSVLKGLLSVSNKSKNVLIHDASRPFVTNSIISNCLSALNNAKGAAPIIDLSSSIIEYDGNSGNYLDRSTLRLVQTPQCFQKQFILDIFESNVDGTDEIGMVLKLYPETELIFLPGDINNFKITTKLDLILAKGIIKYNKNND